MTICEILLFILKIKFHQGWDRSFKVSGVNDLANSVLNEMKWKPVFQFCHTCRSYLNVE